MGCDVQRITLSCAMTPGEWAGIFAPNIFAFDCFETGTGFELITRIEGDKLTILETLVFHGDGARITPARVVPSPRGSRIEFDGPCPKMLEVIGPQDTLSLQVQPSQNTAFSGLNTIFTITVEPDAQVITDWLSYHAKAQNAQAALIFVRGAQSFDVDSFMDELVQLTSGVALKALYVVPCDVPLGHPKMPAESDRHLAPDAPGKAMLSEPVMDPWRSPIFELAVLEVARRRFLADAQAVLYCQPHDLITSTTNSVFEVAADLGFIKFQGKRAYPYALNDKKPPRHADHNCISFDGKRAENIWCAAPAKMEPNAFWRQFRVTNTTEAATVGQSYWRCMALRHPQLKVGELVPKSSLVADDDLAVLMKDHFDARPKAPPAVKRANPANFKNDKTLIITTMKNEGPFILEWLAYHRAIGVTDFLVYTNDCTDGTDEMFDLLHAKGLLEHAENPYKQMHLKPQHAALQAASETAIVAKADWVICMDVDEFINIHVGDGTLKALFKAVPDATLISLTWRLFGNGDVAGFEDRPIIEQFDQCAPIICRKPHQAWGFKTLFRNLDHYKKFGVHRPKGLRPEYLDQITWVNGSGERMPDKMLRTGWRSSTNTVGYDLVTLNHYALRSAESFLVKRDRGRVNHVDRDQGLAYWFRMNHNAQTESSIASKLPLFHAEFARLMADPEIAAMHAKCVAAHRKRIAELMAADEYKTLYDEITGARLRALSRMLDKFGNQTFLDGPDAVPQDFHLTS